MENALDAGGVGPVSGGGRIGDRSERTAEVDAYGTTAGGSRFRGGARAVDFASAGGAQGRAREEAGIGFVADDLYDRGVISGIGECSVCPRIPPHSYDSQIGRK